MNKARWQFLAENLQLERLTNVVDIGANPLGDPPYRDYLDAKLCRVFGFEPQAEAFTKLQNTKSPLETYFQHAVGSGQDHKLNVYRESGLSSFFELDMETVKFLGRSIRAAKLQQQVSISTRRLDDIENLSIDLLKIDVQGSEPTIFDNGQEKLRNAVAVITELRFFPLYYGEQLQDAQITRLADLGLMFHKMLFTKSKMVDNSQSSRLRARALRTQAIDGDAVFVKDLRKPERFSNEQLGHLALISDAVFASYDLSLRCLDLLVERGVVNKILPNEYVGYLPSNVVR